MASEVNALPRRELPSTASLMFNHPGILGYAVKGAQEYAADNKRARYLEKIRADHPDLEALDSPYYNRGVLSAGSPLANAVNWYSSLPAMAYHGAEALGNKADELVSRLNGIEPVVQYPDASKKMAMAANTFLLPIGGIDDAAFGGTDSGAGTILDASDQAHDARGQVPWTTLRPQRVNAASQQAAENEIRSLLPSGETMLRKQGVNPTAARWWGMGMDTMIDPFSATMSALKAARAGMGRQAAMLMAGDHGLPAVITGAGEVRRAYDEEDR